MSNAGEVGHFNLACDKTCAETADWAALDADMVTFYRGNAALNDSLLTTHAEMRAAMNAGEFGEVSGEDRRRLEALADLVTKGSAATQAYLLGAERVRDTALATPCDPFYRTLGICTRIVYVSGALATLAEGARDNTQG